MNRLIVLIAMTILSCAETEKKVDKIIVTKEGLNLDDLPVTPIFLFNYNHHDYIQFGKYSNQTTIVHNPDCSNLKCKK